MHILPYSSCTSQRTSRNGPWIYKGTTRSNRTYEEAGKNSLDYTGCFIDLVDDRERPVVSATLVALAALCLMLGFKIIERPDFRAKIAWDSIIFIGCIINLAAVFPAWV